AVAARERDSAKAAVAEMTEIALDVEKESLRQSYLWRVIDCYAGLKDTRALKRCLREFSKHDRREVLDTSMLIRLGMKDEAIKRAGQDIAQELRELREMDDPNIHFPVMSIARSLEFLAAQREKEEARRWVRRIISEIPKWPAVERGWTTSSVYHSLAEAIVAIDGPAAVADPLRDAMTDARVEKRSDFRREAGR